MPHTHPHLRLSPIQRRARRGTDPAATISHASRPVESHDRTGHGGSPAFGNPRSRCTRSRHLGPRSLEGRTTGMEAHTAGYVERCRRTWSHGGPDCCCAYVGAGAGPTTLLLDGQDFLCACGNCLFPPHYCLESAGDWWDELSKYAVRAAISLPFPAAFLEDDCAASGELRETIGRDLLACDRCLGDRYCSEKWQEDDWENHKRVCKKI
ncbi:hypothetical protein F5Y04DRAFT_288658 [Hypomontagnella monticulosa]|nr:hypothetical protein F5Y04DRAFT_288658 [Hypomontagnella monticulosa]